MLNDDFNNALKEKLEGYEAPFHPADWQRMEAMLPKRSDKFFIAIALIFMSAMLGTTGLIVNHLIDSLEKDEIAAGSITASSTSAFYMTDKEQRSPDSEFLSATCSAKSIPPVAMPENPAAGIHNEKADRTGIADSGKSEIAYNRTKFSTTQESQEDQEKNSSINAFNPEIYDGNQDELPALGIALIGANLAPILPIAPPDEINSVSKTKRRIFEFAIGAGAGMNNSFIRRDYQTTPGYSVGVAEELIFIERIGLALSQAYVHRRYDGGPSPCDQSNGMNYSLSYSSDVHSLDFGVDVKAHIVNKAKWRWYVKAGIISVVKLKETFGYHDVVVDTLPQPPTHGFNQTFDLSSEDAPEPDRTISGERRFHMAYNFATGFDINISSRWKLQFETGYSFTKPVVSDADRRLHTLGMNGRALFMIGKPLP